MGRKKPLTPKDTWLKLSKNLAPNRYFLLRYYVLSLITLLAAYYLIHVVKHEVLWFPNNGIDLLCHLLFIGIVALGGLEALGIGAILYLSVLVNQSALSTLNWPVTSLLAIFSAAFGCFSAALMHQAAHQNFKHHWQNKLVGELCSLHQLIGFLGWKIPHIVHHKKADLPDQDPHAPGDLGFFRYARRMKRDIVTCLKNCYLDTFADDQARGIWKSTLLLLIANRIAKTYFWYVLLGPVWFLFIFVTSYVSQLLFYIHFNWSTHRPNRTGTIEIINIKDGLYFKVMNKLFWGIFYHGNHHEFPDRFDPREETA